jgi:nitrate reductase NapE component
VFKFGGHLELYTFRFPIRDSVSFKFGGIDKHSVCLFHILSICFIGCFDCFCLYIFDFVCV